MGGIDPNHHFMNHLWVDAINEAGCHPITPSIFVAKIGHMIINNNNLDIFGQGSERMLGGDGGILRLEFSEVDAIGIYWLLELL